VTRVLANPVHTALLLDGRRAPLKQRLGTIAGRGGAGGATPLAADVD
jgi:hypothetical protein